MRRKEWFTSSRSGSNGGQCVEVRQDDEEIRVRDSKDRTGPVLAFTSDEWDAFVAGAKAGEFDR